YPNSEFLFFLRNWNDVQGFIGLSTAYFIHLASLLQCDLGISGAIGEIGAPGGSFAPKLCFASREGRNSLQLTDLDLLAVAGGAGEKGSALTQGCSFAAVLR
ncbi:unnamed protein product, partial [Polarella glacialis]